MINKETLKFLFELMMNFTAVEFPSTIDFNCFKAYFDLSQVKLPKVHGKLVAPQSNAATTAAAQTAAAGAAAAIDGMANAELKSLRHLVLDAIADQFHEYPIFKEIPRQEDRNYILCQLDMNLPIKLLSAHIDDDFFWRKCYQHRWKTYNQSVQTAAKSWLNIYMERHLQEFLEQLETTDYDVERMQNELDICAAYINQLEIKYLQPNNQHTSSMDAPLARNDHIPLDYVLHNLPELHALRLTYCTKTVGMNFYLGCNVMSQNDIYLMARGLSRCYELLTFCLHNIKLEAYQLKFIARSLDKGCQNLTHLELPNCSLGDEGIRQFVESCYKESFSTLRHLDLTNNKITSEGAYILSRVLRRVSLESLIIRLNPIESDGTATLFFLINFLPMNKLDISGCSICPAIMKLLMKLLIQNRTIKHLDLSNNHFGEEFGKHLFKIIGFNKTLEHLDLRNTGMSYEMRNRFKEILKKNLPKSEDSKFRVFKEEPMLLDAAKGLEDTV